MAGDASLRVGLDLIEIERIRSALERPRFRERCFTETERRYCDSRANPAQSYAARFAGKEAVGKALGCGVHFTWAEIEIAGEDLFFQTTSRTGVVVDSGVIRRVVRPAG